MLQSIGDPKFLAPMPLPQRLIRDFAQEAVADGIPVQVTGGQKMGKNRQKCCHMNVDIADLADIDQQNEGY